MAKFNLHKIFYTTLMNKPRFLKLVLKKVSNSIFVIVITLVILVIQDDSFAAINCSSTEFVPPESNERILYTLASPRLKVEGPNCYNSVLFSLGIAQGLYFDDFAYWAGSPLCNPVVGNPAVNDLIHIRRLDQEVNRFESEHIYQTLEDGQAFNKAGMSLQMPYEIISISQSMDSYNIPSSCRFVTQEQAKELGCELYSEVYRCSGVDRYTFARDEVRDPALLRLSELARMSTDLVVNGTQMNFTDLITETGNIAQIALSKLGTREAYDRHGRNLRSMLIDAYNNGYPAEANSPTEDDLYEIFCFIFILASPDRHDEFYSDVQRRAISEFRRRGIYSQLSPLDRVVWGGAYENANSIQAQFRIALPDDVQNSNH